MNGDPALKEVPPGGEGDRGTCAAARKGASALPARSEWGSPFHVPGSLSQNDQEGILEEGTLELKPHEKDTKAEVERKKMSWGCWSHLSLRLPICCGLSGPGLG